MRNFNQYSRQQRSTESDKSEKSLCEGKIMSSKTLTFE